jgi:hypothetical protein
MKRRNGERKNGNNYVSIQRKCPTFDGVGWKNSARQQTPTVSTVIDVCREYPLCLPLILGEIIE